MREDQRKKDILKVQPFKKCISKEMELIEKTE